MKWTNQNYGICFFTGSWRKSQPLQLFCFHGWCQAKLILSWWPGISSRGPRSVSITSCCHPLNLPWTFDEDKIQETVHSSICVVTWRGGHVFPGLNSVLHVSRDLFPIPQVAEQAPHSPHSPKITETISLSCETASACRVSPWNSFRKLASCNFLSVIKCYFSVGIYAPYGHL